MLERTAHAIDRPDLPPHLRRLVYGFWSLLRDQPTQRGEAELVAAIVAHKWFRPGRLRVNRLRRWLAPAEMDPTPYRWAVPELPTVAALATWLDVEPSELLWLADLRGTADHYLRRWSGSRLIEAPRNRLKRVQRALAGGLLSAIPVHEAAHGFCARRSVLTAVTPHSGQPMVVAFDLQKFFQSIRASRVHALFRTAGYPRDAARVLAGLCTTTTPDEVCDGWTVNPRPFHRARHVPQGAPTSPAIANLSAFGLDRRLSGLAGRLGAYYTRYADDLLFSGPRSLGRRAFAGLVESIVCEEGFALNPVKTRAMGQASRQLALGLVLNDRPRLPRRERELLEATLVNCVRRGPDGQNRTGGTSFRERLAGRVAWARQVEPEFGERLEALYQEIAW